MQQEICASTARRSQPARGCLPILVQMPFFIALYWVLLSSVEMRNAPWIGWITDLAAPDPWFILPILMTASSMFQVWLNPTPPDPMQAKLMWFMPLAFGFMFFFFPAGLVLYWLTNNILSIAQQWFIKQATRRAGQIVPPLRIPSRQRGPAPWMGVEKGAGNADDGGCGDPAPTERLRRSRAQDPSGLRTAPPAPFSGVGAPESETRCAPCPFPPARPSGRGRHRDPSLAVATPRGAGVGIVRASGRDLSALIQSVCGRALVPRQATLLDFVGSDGQAMDRGLAIHFPAPHSYTGEDVLELQAHGDRCCCKLLLARCLEAIARAAAGRSRRIHRACLSQRQARPSRRPRRWPTSSMPAPRRRHVRRRARCRGRSLSEVKRLAERLVQLRLLVEATLDFPEEEIDFLEQAGARGQLDAIEAILSKHFTRARQGALLREGLHVVNRRPAQRRQEFAAQRLAGAELAIVTPNPRHDARPRQRDDPDRRRAAARSRYRGPAQRTPSTRSSASASAAAGRPSRRPTPCCSCTTWAAWASPRSPAPTR